MAQPSSNAALVKMLHESARKVGHHHRVSHAAALAAAQSPGPGPAPGMDKGMLNLWWARKDQGRNS